MSALIFKIIHIIGFISWFAAIFYLGRMFVYHAEALGKSEPEKGILTKQLQQMEWRVYKIIMTPAMTITWIAGLCIIYSYGWDWFKINLWLHYKLLFLLILSAYHGYSKKLIQKFEKGEMPLTSMAARLFNEVPTVLMILIVSLAVLKNMTRPWVLTIVVFIIIALLITFTFIYRSFRKKKEGSIQNK